MKRNQRNAFTLVELLTVMAIIVLLVGILVPALSAARDQAKKASTTGQIGAIEKGIQLFHTELDKYPVSTRANPFESSTVPLTGAQWLALQLVGADGAGFVKDDLKNDTSNSGTADGRINATDWLQWYSLSPAGGRKFARLNPLVDQDGKTLRTPAKLVAEHPEYGDLPAAMTAGSSEWNNDKIPMFIDAFGYPILYYAATLGAEQPITTGNPSSNLKIGTYDLSDNAAITGAVESATNGNGNFGRFPVPGPGWDFASANQTPIHPFGVLGYTQGQATWPASNTFAASICDRNIFDTTQRGNQGRLAPLRADSYILVSPGRDGRYGTNDDVRNYPFN